MRITRLRTAFVSAGNEPSSSALSSAKAPRRLQGATLFQPPHTQPRKQFTEDLLTCAKSSSSYLLSMERW